MDIILKRQTWYRKIENEIKNKEGSLQEARRRFEADKRELERLERR